MNKVSCFLASLFVWVALLQTPSTPIYALQTQAPTVAIPAPPRALPTASTKQQSPPAKPISTAPQPVPLSDNHHYTNSDGNVVHSPANASAVPAGASAQCGDSTFSFSKHRQGTCSHHGGVARWF